MSQGRWHIVTLCVVPLQRCSIGTKLMTTQPTAMPTSLAGCIADGRYQRHTAGYSADGRCQRQYRFTVRLAPLGATGATPPAGAVTTGNATAALPGAVATGNATSAPTGAAGLPAAR
eukprot:162759-Chlamydomonas_euryale.AAC.2